MPAPKPLTPAQASALVAIREARVLRDVARRNRSLEIERRLADVKARIAIEVDDQITALERSLNEAMVAAVEQGVSIRRIAFDAMGATYDGSVRRIIHEAMADARRGSLDEAEAEYRSRFGGEGDGASQFEPDAPPVSGNSFIPEPIWAQADGLQPPVGGPRFTLVDPEHILFDDGSERITVPTVAVEIDPLDPWILEVRENGRKGSEFLNATTCTIYRNPGTGKMVALESREDGASFYDHLAARWVKDHQEQASAGYDEAIERASLTSDEA